MSNIEELTEKLISDYLIATGRGDGGRAAISPIEYLSFRKAAIEELSSGISGICFSEKNIQSQPNYFHEKKHNTNYDTSNKEHEIFKNKIIKEQSSSKINDISTEDEKCDLLSILSSVPG